MIGVFEGTADTPTNLRKHRRFDKEPPDRGGPGNRPTQTDVVVDADGVMDSCPDATVTTMPQQPIVPDVTAYPISVAIGTSKTVDDNSPYGPWMVVEPRPRRAPRKQVENNMRQHGKSAVISKASTGTDVRKTLTLYDFPVLSRNSHKAGSSKPFPPNVVSLDAYKRSVVVVVNENTDPNVLQSMRKTSDPSHMQYHLLGEPPDLNLDIGGNSEPNVVCSKALDIAVVADAHSQELGGDHAITMLE
ncbi:hypothetical protein V6N13_148485 [Hibiscus sabdariffa]